MINFKEEIQKYRPIMEIEQVEEAVYNDELQDLVEILLNMSKKMKTQESNRY